MFYIPHFIFHFLRFIKFLNSCVYNYNKLVFAYVDQVSILIKKIFVRYSKIFEISLQLYIGKFLMLQIWKCFLFHKCENGNE